MSSSRSGELIAEVRDLEQRDRQVADQIEDTNAVLRLVDDVRARAQRVRVALEVLPTEIGKAEHAVIDAQAREAAARRDSLDAERLLTEALRSKRASNDAKTAAERTARRAKVQLIDATDAVARQEERLRHLLSDQVALRAEAEGLSVEARTVARDIAALPRVSESGRTPPGAGLEGIVEWGARAHSAIFVVRGGLESERERIVYEAAALAASALGEQVAGASVALVRRRLEQELGQLG